MAGINLSDDQRNRYSVEFSTMLFHLLQQKGGYLRQWGMQVEQEGSSKKSHSRIESLKMKARAPRGSDTEAHFANYNQRWITTKPFDLHILTDKVDDIRSATGDPTSAIMQEMYMAAKRLEDQIIINALVGRATVGENGDQFVDLPDTNTVAVDFGQSKNIGLSVGKLLEAHTNLKLEHALDANLDMMEEAKLAITSKQTRDLMYAVEVNSVDHNNIKALQKGGIGSYMGFDICAINDFQKNEDLFLPKEGNIRDCIAFSTNAFMYSELRGVDVQINKRSDKNNILQISIDLDFGAVRWEEERVQIIKADESWVPNKAEAGL